jgi:hypothetical protein
VTLGHIFSEYFGLPWQFLFHRLFHIHHHLSSGASTIGQIVADVPSELCLTPLEESKKNWLRDWLELLIPRLFEEAVYALWVTEWRIRRKSNRNTHFHIDLEENNRSPLRHAVFVSRKEKNHERPQSGHPVIRLILESSNSPTTESYWITFLQDFKGSGNVNIEKSVTHLKKWIRMIIINMLSFCKKPNLIFQLRNNFIRRVILQASIRC